MNRMDALEQKELCDKLIEFGRQGKSYAQMAAALDISRQTLYQWRANYPQINDALTRARDYSLAWWEDRGMDGMFTQGFNASLWAKQVSCRFPDDYTDKNKQELTGAGGTPLVVSWRK